MTRVRLVCFLLIAIGLCGFAYRTVLRAYVDSRNDLADPYCASRLWLQGQNPYDVRLATGMSAEQTHIRLRLVPIYPPTAYVLVVPISLIPWKLANLSWAMLGLLAVTAMAYLLPRIASMSWREDRTWLLVACVFCAAPLHTALHAGNSAAVVICLCMLALCLAKADRDIWAGLVTAIAICLKPQVGIWILVFYLVRGRWKIVIHSAAAVATITVVALLRMPLSPMALLQNYASNLHYWFDPGKMNDFSAANHFRFEMVNAQVLLQPLAHDRATANVIAWLIFVGGLGIWFWIVSRRPIRDELLAISTLLMLSMIPVYHRSYDSAIVLLAVGWVLRSFELRSGIGSLATLLPLGALLAPTPSAVLEALSHGQPALRDLASSSMIAVYSPLAVMLLSFVLLYRLAVSTHGYTHVANAVLPADGEGTHESSSEVLLVHES